MPGSESPLDEPSLAERLLLAMKRAGLTQVDLARQLHTDSRVLRRYLSGQRTPAPELIAEWERVCGLAPGELSAPETPASPQPSSNRRTTVRPPARRWLLWTSIGVGLVVVVVAIVMWRSGSSNIVASRVDRPDAVPCPSPPKDAKFVGRTFKDGVVLRQGASQDFPPLARLAGDCDVGFAGYCIGQPIVDVTVNTLDSRWFILRAVGPLNGGLVASGVIKGNPADGVLPVACAGSRVTAAHVVLAASTSGEPAGQLRLHASAPGADIVGFAALGPIAGAVSPSAQWQQLGFAQSSPEFSIVLNQSSAPHLVAGDVTVIAVVCFAAGAPTTTEAITVIAVTADGSAKSSDGTTSAEPGPEARQAACRYPSNPSGGTPTTTAP